MIRINLLSAMNRNVAAALAAIRARSFSGRNPQLGPMINCPVCKLRHRKTNVVKGVVVKCEAKYAPHRFVEGDKIVEGEPQMAAQNTLKGVFGAAFVAKKRFHPHPSKKKLQLVQRTQELYPQNSPYITDPVECMKESRKQAARQLKDERNGIHRPQVSTKTRNRRQDKQTARTAANLMYKVGETANGSQSS